MQTPGHLKHQLMEPYSLPQVRNDDENKLYGEKQAGTESPQPVRNPLAQGDIQDNTAGGDGLGNVISAPADLTGMTGQYITGKDAGSISEQWVHTCRMPP